MDFGWGSSRWILGRGATDGFWVGELQVDFG